MEHWNRYIDRFEGSLPRERIWLTIDTPAPAPVCDRRCPVVLTR
jgi:hypothetical protein